MLSKNFLLFAIVGGLFVNTMSLSAADTAATRASSRKASKESRKTAGMLAAQMAALYPQFHAALTAEKSEANLATFGSLFTTFLENISELDAALDSIRQSTAPRKLCAAIGVRAGAEAALYLAKTIATLHSAQDATATRIYTKSRNIIEKLGGSDVPAESRTRPKLIELLTADASHISNALWAELKGDIDSLFEDVEWLTTLTDTDASDTVDANETLRYGRIRSADERRAAAADRDGDTK